MAKFADPWAVETTEQARERQARGFREQAEADILNKKAERESAVARFRQKAEETIQGMRNEAAQRFKAGAEEDLKRIETRTPDRILASLPEEEPPAEPEEVRFPRRAAPSPFLAELKGLPVAPPEAEPLTLAEQERLRDLESRVDTLGFAEFGEYQALAQRSDPRLRAIAAAPPETALDVIRTTGRLATRPFVPESALEQIRRIPYAGRPLSSAVAGLTSPLGLASTAAFPVLTAAMTAGGVVGGALGGLTGERGEMIGELAGSLGAPVAPGLARLGLRAAEKAVPGVARTELALKGVPQVTGGFTVKIAGKEYTPYRSVITDTRTLHGVKVNKDWLLVGEVPGQSPDTWPARWFDSKKSLDSFLNNAAKAAPAPRPVSGPEARRLPPVTEAERAAFGPPPTEPSERRLIVAMNDTMAPTGSATEEKLIADIKRSGSGGGRRPPPSGGRRPPPEGAAPSPAGGEPPTAFDAQAERNIRVGLAQAKDLREPGALDDLLRPVNRIIDPGKARSPVVQAAAEARGNFAEAEATRRSVLAREMEKKAENIFGKDTVEGPSRKYVARFTEPRVKDDEGIVGSLAHIIDKPEQYRLTPAERTFVVGEHDAILRRDLTRTRGLGADVGEVASTYISYAIKQDDPQGVLRAVGAGGVARAQASFQRGRDSIDLVDFAKRVRAQGYAPELNYGKLLAKRLYAAGRVQADQLFINEMKPLAKRGIGGETVGHPRFGNLTFEPDLAADIRQIMNPDRIEDATARFVSTGIDALREVLLNFDLSGGVGIQGVRFFMSEGPVGFVARLPRVVQFVASREGYMSWIATHSDDIQLSQLHGLRVFSQPFEAGPKGPLGRLALEHIPVLGKILGPPTKALNEVQYGRLVAYYKFTTWQHYVDVLRGARDSRFQNLLRSVPGVGRIIRKMGGLTAQTSDEAIIDAAGAAVNNIYGGLRVEKVGSSWMQRLVLLTPQWLRANIGSLVTAVEVGDPQAILARRWLAQSLALSAGLSAGITLARTGHLPNFTESRRSDWLSIGGPEGGIGIFPLRVYVRTIARIVAPREGESRVEQGVRFLGGRVAQPASIATELITGKDYLGRDIGDRGRFVLEQLMPIALQSALETQRTSRSGREAAERIPLEFAGFSFQPKTGVQRQAEIARQPLSEVDVDVRQRLEADPKYKRAIEQARRESRERGQPFTVALDEIDKQRIALKTEQDKDDIALDAGRMDVDRWKDNFRDRQVQMAGIRQGVMGALGVSFEEKEAAKLPPIRRALEAYFDISPTQFMDTTTREVDWPAFFEAREKTLAGLTPGQRAAADKEITKNLTPEGVRFRQASATLRKAPPKYRGLTAEDAATIDKFVREVDTRARTLATDIARERGTRVSEAKVGRLVAQYLAQQRGRPILAEVYAVLQKPKEREKRLNPDYSRYILDHETELRTFYPDLYSQATLERAGEIGAQAPARRVRLRTGGGLIPVGSR